MGRRDSNPRMTGPKPVALPLGDTPKNRIIVKNRLIVNKFKLQLAKKFKWRGKICAKSVNFCLNLREILAKMGKNAVAIRRFYAAHLHPFERGCEVKTALKLHKARQ